MKRVIYLLLIIIAASCCVDAGPRRDSSSLAGSVEIFESYKCSVSFMIDGNECPVADSRVYIEKISNNRVKISIEGCFNPQRPYNVQTTVDLIGALGDVKIDGDFILTYLQNEEEVFAGAANVSGFIINHGVTVGSGTELAVQDLEADISLHFEDNHKYIIRCYNIIGPNQY